MVISAEFNMCLEAPKVTTQNVICYTEGVNAYFACEVSPHCIDKLFSNQ